MAMKCIDQMPPPHRDRSGRKPKPAGRSRRLTEALDPPHHRLRLYRERDAAIDDER
jgi:hypothetical protein